jgi:hypothetical protein
VISDSDYQWLASVEATEAWSFLQSDLRQPGSKIPTSLASLRRLSTNQRQLLEQQLNFAMGSAKRKVRFPDRWFWTQQLFEQASDEWTAEETAKDVYRTLVAHNLLRTASTKPELRFQATGNAESFAVLARRFLGPEVQNVEQIQ